MLGLDRSPTPREQSEAPIKASSRSSLAVVRLNDLGTLSGPLPPWPPLGGLPAGQDPFAARPEGDAIEEAFTPGFLRARVRGRGILEVDPGRAAAVSVVLHLALILYLLLAPPSKSSLAGIPAEKMPDPMGLLAIARNLQPEAPVPIQFFPAPGPAAKTPGKNPLPSDVDRQAHGGDPKLAKADTPKAVPLAGVQELEPGRRGPKGAPEPAAGVPHGREAENREIAQSQEGMASPFQPRPSERRGSLSGIPTSALKGLTSDQVARLRRERGNADGGDEGGGWDREGGFVDQGPLSFDTQGYDWGSYAAEMLRRIKRNWEVPQLAYYGVKGKLTIRFFILKDGRVEGARILSSSAIPPYDNSALQAILRSNPFRPLPADLGKDREGVTVTFLYNIRPSEYQGR